MKNLKRKTANSVTIVRGKFVCLFVCLSDCLSYPSGVFCVARSRTPTAAFESLGLRYVPPTFLPSSSQGQPEGGLSCQPAISIVLSAAFSASWRHLANDGHLKVLADTFLVIYNSIAFAAVSVLVLVLQQQQHRHKRLQKRVMRLLIGRTEDEFC